MKQKTDSEKIEEILGFFQKNNISEYKQGVVIKLHETALTIKFPRGENKEKVAMLKSGKGWALVNKLFDNVYSNLFESYNPYFPIKRDNWTTQEIYDMMEKFPATEESLKWGDYLTEMFYDMSRPLEEFGAMAYQPMTKSFVHVGKTPE